MISIIVPVYNAEKTLERCVRSLMAQTEAEIEILLVDDGSADRSGELCDRLSKEDARIRVLHQPNGGVSSARNAGLAASHGEFIQFVDSDDAVEPDYCRLLLKAINDGDSGWAICGYQYRKAGKSVPCVPQNTGTFTLPELAGEMDSLYRGWLLSSPWNKMYRRSLIRKVFDTTLTLGEDFLFNLEYLCGVSRVALIAATPYLYEADAGGSATRKGDPEFYKDCGERLRREETLLREAFGEDFSLPALREVYLSDVLLMLGRRTAAAQPQDRDALRGEMSRLREDPLFSAVAKDTVLPSRQQRTALHLLMARRFGSLLLFYQILKKAGKIY